MCDYSGKIIAWLDRELDGGEMTDVERHVGQCVECRTQLRAYEQVSKTFRAYCDEVMAASLHRKVPRRVAVLSGAAAVAVAVAAALLVVFSYTHLKTRDLPPSVKADPPASIVVTTPAPTSLVVLSKAVHRHAAPARARTQNANWLPVRPAIEIAIPADSMFPPGAVPEGVNFIADLSIAPDGSTQQIRLQPRLIGFERRVIQP
jgi:hypothetical protein